MFIILAFGQMVNSQDVKMSGSGNGFSGAEIRIFSLTDPVTRSLKPIKRVTCDDKGNFSFTVPVNKNATIYLKAGVFTWYIYAKAGKEYRLKLGEFIAKPASEEQNPFFEEVRMIPEVVNDTSDINNLIRKFDAEYDKAFNMVTDRVVYNIKRSDIPSIVEKLNALSKPGMPSFFSEFVRFRMIMINMVGSGEYAGRVEDSVMINREFVPDNQAYIDLIEQRFSGYFASVLNGPHKDNFVRAIGNSSLDEVRKVIEADGKVTNRELIEYILLLNLYPSWYERSIPPDNIMLIISSLAKDGSSEYIRELAVTVSERILSLSAGSAAPVLTLKDADGNEITVPGNGGRFILLSFTRSDNAQTMAEYSILNTWYRKYSSDLQVITILTDRDYRTAAARLKSAGFGWTMLNGSMQDMAEYLYNVRVYPTFTLIGADGKIISQSCTFPSENLERTVALKVIRAKN
jgi:hypothetical protein